DGLLPFDSLNTLANSEKPSPRAAIDCTIEGHRMTDTLTELRRRTIWQTVDSWATRVPDRAALVAGDDAGAVQRVTYAALADRVRALSGGLAAIGGRRGDRVVVWITNTPEWVVTAFGAVRIGASVVRVDTVL